MRLFLVSTAVFLFCGVASFAEAGDHGGLLQKLPKDGRWAKYHFQMKVKVPVTQEILGAISLRSVGRVTKNGEPCRWIEMQMDVVENDRTRTSLFKILVQEKAFRSGTKTSPHVLRGWGPGGVQLSDSDINGSGVLNYLLGRRLAKKKPLKVSKVIDFQRGQLKIAAGTVGQMPLGRNDNTVVTQRLWSHQTVPFGVAAMEYRVVVKDRKTVATEMSMEFTLQDYGTGAKSLLPDKR